jgi:feruloyl-CoA synthase
VDGGDLLSVPRTPRFAPAEVLQTPLHAGGVELRSPIPLAPYARCLGDLLVRWAREAPERTFLAERPSDAEPFARTTYEGAHALVRRLARGLKDAGVTPERPLMLLSDNGVEHALLQLAGMHVGLPVAPVSPAYSVLSQDFAKLLDIAAQLQPGAIYASNGAAYARALGALGAVHDAAVIVGRTPPAASRRKTILFRELAQTSDDDWVDDAFAAVGPDTVAKILFTSGSTGSPKGIVNTQRMLCSNQQAIAQTWPLLDDRPPVLVDWLPWSHTFGGNHNFDMVLRNGGTLYIDAGKPAPGMIERSVKNLREVSPTLYFNVPRGFDMLLPFLESDHALRESFFRELDLVFYAAAALPQSLWERLARIGAGVTMASAWGATETSPLVTQVHFPIPRAGVIGLPAAGCVLRLVRQDDKLEMRVKGPNVTPGYWEPGGRVRPLPVDDDGFYATGDAGRLEDPRAPEKGVVFDGRTAENFKLSTGTWVCAGEVRIGVIAACAPQVSDAVVCGHDRDFVSLLLFVKDAAAVDRAILRASLAAWNDGHPASSTRIARALVMSEPPSIDAGEITDKGYINQRAVLTRRAALVERLYATEPDADVVVA